jgi:hypothetical protein
MLYNARMKPNVELAYLAGAMDSDGFISMTKRVINGSVTYSEFIGLAQVTDTVPKMLQERFGGYIQLRTRRGEAAKNWRPIYYWAATTKLAANAIGQLRPYLRVKAEQADVLLALRASKARPASERRAVKVGVRGRALNPEVQTLREDLYRRVKKLNANGRQG